MAEVTSTCRQASIDAPRCKRQWFIDGYSRVVCDLCMMPVMVKEADLDRIGVPEDYEVLNATALGRRLGCKRDTVFAYLPQSLALSS